MKKYNSIALCLCFVFSMSSLFATGAPTNNQNVFEAQWNLINSQFSFPWNNNWTTLKEDSKTTLKNQSISILEDAVGAVYAMTNGDGQIDGNVQGPNSIVAYSQAEDGTLMMMGSFPTGGNGGDYDGGEGLDPLISAYAITKTLDNRFVLAVNAGSNTVTSMRVNEDFTLTVVDTESTEDVGPNSIAVSPSSEAGVNGIAYVSNITRPDLLDLGEPGHQGSVIGYRLMEDGSLETISGSQRDLNNRPSAVQFSPNGDFLVVTSINSGASGLTNGNEDEVVVYAVNGDGTLSENQTGTATSTLRGNTEGRNLPSAIGFQVVGDNYVVVTEAREFQPNGAPPAFPALQDGSVSTWQILADGTLTPISMDIASGENNTGRTACWLDFSDENTFFVSNAIEAGLASYSFDNGVVELLNQTAAQGTGATGNTTDPGLAFGTTEGWIDLWISDDGQYLYQCYGLTGEVGVYAIDGSELTLLQEIGGLPQNNVQGIVSVGQPSGTDPGDPDDMVCEADGGVLSGGPFDFNVGDGNADNIGADEIVLTGGTQQAVAVQFEFEVMQPVDGFFVTEPWVGLHNGNFDLFNVGERATPGLESLAEGGNTELLGSEFAQPGRLQTTIGNGQVQFTSPGETISGSIDVRNPLNYRYASFATMIIPSNDGFFGNENPLEFEIFDENGNFNGPIDIVLTGSDLWDAGTEVNNASGAAGFSQGFDGMGSGPSTDDPTSTVAAHPGLANLLGLQTAAGTTIASDIDPNEPVLRLRITVGAPINTVQAVGPLFEGSVVEDDASMDAVQFEFEVMQPVDGFFVTEPWVGLHNGNFDLFNVGDRATPGLESLAEGGNTELLGSEFAQPGRLQATIGNGQVQFISPGETISGSIDVRNPLNYRYASFATMIIPSNDGFFGNEDPLAFEIFDENGNFNGPIDIVLTGADLWDAGTEVNNASGAAGFSQGFDGSGSGPSTDDPNSTIATHPGLANLLGLQTAAGTTIGSDIDPNEPVLRIRISLGAPINTVQAVGPRFQGSVVTPPQGWIVTDAGSGEILGLPASFTDFDFDVLSPGVSNVFYYASQGDITGLEVGANVNDIEGCFDLSNPVEVNRNISASGPAVGAVYAMTNGEGQVPGIVQGPNSVVAYAQAADGTLTEMGTFATGGNGGDFDGGEGLDPLISAYALTKTIDNRFVLAVNAGSNTVTSMRVNEDFTLTVIDTESTEDIGPNSIAHAPSMEAGVNGLVYVSNITRPEFLDLGEPGHQGSLIGYRLMDDGSLEPIAGSQRDLANRPSAVQFSPDGNWIVATSINSGAAGLGSGNEDEIVLYSVNADGTLSANQTAGATSTLRGNTDGRNLPSAIGFQIVQDNYVVVTEAREFQPDGTPPAFPALQDGSVSTWQIQSDGSLTPISLDVASGENNTGRTACWLDFSDDNTFFVSNAIEAGLASYSFNDGVVELLNQTAASGVGVGTIADPATAFATTEGWIDLWISDDGQYLYQCEGLAGQIGVYAIDGAELTFLQSVGGLPQNNVQGIVSVGQPADVVGGGSDGVDLVLDIEVDNGLYNIFEEVVYTITVTNNGDTEATNVVVDAGLPSGMVFASANFDSGNYELFLEEWTINSVAPGETATLNLTLFTLIENVDIVNNVQIVAVDQVDSNASNNFDSVTIRPFSFGGVGNADGTIDLELSLTAPSANFVQFENVDFMLTLTNNGPDDATGIFVSAPIPSGFAFTGFLASAGDYSYFTQRWNVPELASGETATLRLTLFTLDRFRDLANAVEVFSADQNDSDSTPANLAGNNPVEDDEAVIILIPALTADGIALRNSDNTTIEGVELYPNPTGGLINFNFVSDAEYDTEIQIVDVIGRVIQSHGIVANRGVNNMRMDVSSINAGIYFINFSDKDGNVSNYKFIKID